MGKPVYCPVTIKAGGLDLELSRKHVRPMAVYVLARTGVELGRQLARELGADLFAPARMALEGAVGFENLGLQVSGEYENRSGHIFVAAAGIVVRTIAPLLRGKDSDPAVVVMDPKGDFAVSLIAGHLGGANDLARACASISGGQPVITTATDVAGLPSVDVMARNRNLVIGNIEAVRHVNAALLDGETVQVFDPGDFLKLSAYTCFKSVNELEWDSESVGVWVDWRTAFPQDNSLRLYPRVLHAGIGCRKGTDADEIVTLVREQFKGHGLALESLASIGSVDVKGGEAGLLEAARLLGVGISFFPGNVLDACKVPNPSAAAQKNIGVNSVSEAAAIQAAECGTLVMEKQKSAKATLAVARRK